jgi:hypothetical protein
MHTSSSFLLSGSQLGADGFNACLGLGLDLGFRVWRCCGCDFILFGAGAGAGAADFFFLSAFEEAGAWEGGWAKEVTEAAAEAGEEAEAEAALIEQRL